MVLTFADDLEPVFDLVAVVDGDDAACQQRDGAVDDVRPVQRIRHSVQQQIVEQEKVTLKKREIKTSQPTATQYDTVRHSTVRHSTTHEEARCTFLGTLRQSLVNSPS
jgi:hypothetical protein